MSMRIREGVKYLNRQGEVVGPLTFRGDKNPGMPWVISIGDKKLRSFSSTGNYCSDGSESPFDLVSEHVEEKPVTPIDLMTPAQYKRGVAAVFDSYKIY